MESNALIPSDEICAMGGTPLSEEGWVLSEAPEKLKDPLKLDACLAKNIYHWEGKPYPRLIIAFTETVEGISVSCSSKYKAGEWWGSVPIPSQVFGDLGELLQRAMAELNSRHKGDKLVGVKIDLE
jgi:hypothetical protein